MSVFLELELAQLAWLRAGKLEMGILMDPPRLVPMIDGGAIGAATPTSTTPGGSTTTTRGATPAAKAHHKVDNHFAFLLLPLISIMLKWGNYSGGF
jgi:hypothetical protein